MRMVCLLPGHFIDPFEDSDWVGVKDEIWCFLHVNLCFKISWKILREKDTNHFYHL